MYAIQRSCENKAEVVELDEKESGLNVRATLNLGHTFGHAIQTGVGYGEYLHGEAVSIGTVMAADLSYRLGWIDNKLKARTVDLLKRFDLPIDVPEGSMTKQKFMDLMAVDKKASRGKMNFILLKGEPSRCVFTGDFDQTKVAGNVGEFCCLKKLLRITNIKVEHVHPSRPTHTLFLIFALFRKKKELAKITQDYCFKIIPSYFTHKHEKRKEERGRQDGKSVIVILGGIGVVVIVVTSVVVVVVVVVRYFITFTPVTKKEKKKKKKKKRKENF